MPVAYIPRTRDLYNDFTPYRWVENDSTPFTPLTKPISECRIALISSGGIMYRDQPRFHREDASYRRIPLDARRDELSVWHFGYPTGDAERDVNCVFPLERMRRLYAAAGVIPAKTRRSGVQLHGWNLFGAQSPRRTRSANCRRAEARACRRLLPRPCMTRVPSVRWTDRTRCRRSGNPHALNDFRTRHHAVGEAAARGVR